MVHCLAHHLIPTVASSRAVEGMALAISNNNNKSSPAKHINTKPKLDEEPPDGAVHIKVDSGMSRNGCQPGDLPDLVKVRHYLLV